MGNLAKPAFNMMFAGLTECAGRWAYWHIITFISSSFNFLSGPPNKCGVHVWFSFKTWQTGNQYFLTTICRVPWLKILLDYVKHVMKESVAHLSSKSTHMVGSAERALNLIWFCTETECIHVKCYSVFSVRCLLPAEVCLHTAFTSFMSQHEPSLQSVNETVP